MEIVISIVGFGNIGKLICALLLPYKEHQFILNIVDIDPNISGAVLDLEHGNQLFQKHTLVCNSTDYFNHSDFIFHCAGASVPKGKSRLFTCSQSIEMTESIFKNFKPTKSPFVIVVANPVEIIATITHKITGLPREKIVGTGTFLDSIRMNYYLGKTGNNSSAIDTFILGEHGDTAFISQQLSSSIGLSLTDFWDDETLEKCLLLTKNAAKEIKTTQMATIYGVSYCAIQLFDLLLSDKPVCKPVSILIPENLKKEFGTTDLFLSLPANIDSTGVHFNEDYHPNDVELSYLKTSYEAMRECLPMKYL